MRVAHNVTLVAVDLSTHHGSAILAAFDLHASGAGGVIHLLNVLDPREVVDERGKPALRQEEACLARTATMLEERAQTVALMHARLFPKKQIRAHARIGDAVPTILQACVDYDVDLLICGAHRQHGACHLFEGSVAAALVRQARSPVLVARSKDYAGLPSTRLSDAPRAPGSPPEATS